MQSVTIYKQGINYGFTYVNDKGQYMGEIISFPIELNESLRVIEDHIDEVVDGNKKILNYFISNATDEEKLNAIDIYPSYMIGKKYEEGDEFNYSGKLYRVLSPGEHISQENWIPSLLPAVYTQISLPGQIPEWTQPTGAHDAYDTGDRVTVEGVVYISKISSNVWPPSLGEEYWIREDGEENVPTEPEVPEEYPAWVPWNSDPATLYQIGDIVTHNGKNWIATVGSNHWEPGVSGWDEFVEEV